MKVLFYICCFFPFVKFLGGGQSTSDIQPYCIIVSVLGLLLYGYKHKIYIYKELFRFYIILVLGLVFGTINTIFNGGIKLAVCGRYFATYGGLLIISLMSYIYCQQDKGFNENKIKKIINIYLIVGIIQKFGYRQFAYELLGNARTTVNRGVISLTSEPSFYGYMCVFFLILVLEFKENKKFYIGNLIFQAIFLAESSVTVVYLFILVGLLILYSMRKIKLKHLLIGGMAILLAVIMIRYFLNGKNDGGQRIVYFLNMIFQGKGLTGILEQVNRDASMRERLENITMCIMSFFKRVGIPYGFNTGKIHSGYGSLIYTMGWFGAGMIAYVFRFFRNAYSGGYKKFVMPVFLTIIMFSAIQLANPVFAFLVGYFAYWAHENVLQ